MLEEADLDHEVSNVVSGISDVAITRGPEMFTLWDCLQSVAHDDDGERDEHK